MPEASPPLVQTIADLRTAADLLDERGWLQGAAVHRDGRLCAWRAIRLAVGEPIGSPMVTRLAPRRNRALEALYRHLGHQGIIDWNDTPGRTADEVKATLRGAAEKLEVGR
jgi:hypothetical protein